MQFIVNDLFKPESSIKLPPRSEMPSLCSNQLLRGRFLLKTEDQSWLAEHDLADDLTEYTTLNPAYALSFVDEEAACERARLLADKILLTVEFVCVPWFRYERRRNSSVDSRTISQTTSQT